jgi:CBS domain-containing protein
VQADITELIKPPRVLSASDTVRRAAGAIRASDGSRMLVVKDGRVAGAVSEQAIATALAQADDVEAALDGPIDELVECCPVFVSTSVSAREAARVFAESGLDMLPVVDGWGGLRGAVYRKDVVGLLSRNLRPPTVGGMATPLGVYLTTGSITGGAGSFGLYLTGISLGVLMIVAKLIGDRMVGKLGILAAHYLPPLLNARISLLGLYDLVTAAVSIGIMLLLLRLSPLAGYHGAEHMTVHAIEHGEDLTTEAVRRMPRVHPRCGTNLLGALAIFVLITSQFGGEIAAMVAILVVILGRRAVGDWMQSAFTTKPPTDRQLANGIAAGEQILRRFHEHPSYQVFGFPRIWNMGFIQAAAGMSTVLFAVYLVEKLFKVPVLF